MDNITEYNDSIMAYVWTMLLNTMTLQWHMYGQYYRIQWLYNGTCMDNVTEYNDSIMAHVWKILSKTMTL